MAQISEQMEKIRAPQQLGFVRLALVAPFAQHLRQLGINPGPAYEAVGLSEASARDPNIFVHAEIVYGLLNSFAELAGDQYLGARVGETHDFSEWPPFIKSAQSAKTLAEFFAAFIRVVPTEASSVQHSLVVGPDLATYRVARSIQPAVRPVQVTGFGCAHYVRILRAVAGEAWDAALVTFESKHIDGVPTGYAGIETLSSSDPGMQLSFPVDWLFREVKLDLQTAREGQGQSPKNLDLVLAVRSAVEDRLDAPHLGIVEVAELLGVEPTRLKKALKRSKTTVSREVKRLKVDAAKTKLGNSNDTIRTIASSLGYQHQAHFTRFFLSQTGVSPSDFRSQARKSKKH